MPGPLSPYQALDTPVLLIDRDILMRNIADMQQRADSFGVWLRPHTKTHKCPDIARMQLAAGASTPVARRMSPVRCSPSA